MGDRGEPCGVPLWMLKGAETVVPIFSETNHPMRNECVHQHTLSRKPFSRSTCVAHSGLMLSKKPEMSKRRRAPKDTVQVKELLEMTEQTIIAATQKLSLRRPSHPPTPQTGSVFGQTKPTTALPGSFPVTARKGKQRQPSTGLITGICPVSPSFLR